MTDRWLYAWGMASIALGGASLLVPLYVVELGGGTATLGLLFASASFVGVPGALVFGRLADRTGKRRAFVLASLAVTTVTMLAIPALESITLVIIVNALLWLGAAAATPVLTLLVVAGAPETEWGTFIARLNRYQGIGWAFGLLFGFLVVAVATLAVDTLTAQRIFFLVCAGCGAVGLGIGLRTLPPDPDPETEPSPGRIRARLRGASRFSVRGASFPFFMSRIDPRNLDPRRFFDRFTPRLAVYFGAVLLAFTGFGVFFAPLPAYLSGLGFGSTEIFAVYLLLNVGAAAFFGVVPVLVERFDAARVFVGGLLGRAVAFPSVVILGAIAGGGVLSLGAVGLVFVFIGVTWAVIAVTAATLVSTLSPSIIRGEALGVYSALVALAGGFGGLLGGWLGGIGFLTTFGVAGGFIVVGAVVSLSLGYIPDVRSAPEA